MRAIISPKHTCHDAMQPSAEYACRACIFADETMTKRQLLHHSRKPHHLLVERHPSRIEKALSVCIWAILWLIGLVAFGYLIGLVSR